MDQEIERNQILVNQAPLLLSWIWGENKAPKDLTYEDLLHICNCMWEDEKLWTHNASEKLFNEYLEELSPEDRVKYEASHSLVKEFEYLRFHKRFKDAIEWKMNTLLMCELKSWESEYFN